MVMLYSHLITTISIAECSVCSYFGKLALKRDVLIHRKCFSFFLLGLDECYCLNPIALQVLALSARCRERKNCTLFKQLRAVWFTRLGGGGVERAACLFCKFFLNEVNLWLLSPRLTRLLAG